MSFFQTSNGNAYEQIEQNNGVFDSNPAIQPMPKGTIVPAAAEECGWASYEGENYIEIKWLVLDGQYKNRKVFQKVRIESPETKKRDKAIMMLAAIDKNAGGALRGINEKPNETQLASAFLNKPMQLELDVWKGNDGASGNWVKAVAPIGHAVQAPQAAAEKEADQLGF